jgi:hypothetical protein
MKINVNDKRLWVLILSLLGILIVVLLIKFSGSSQRPKPPAPSPTLTLPFTETVTSTPTSTPTPTATKTLHPTNTPLTFKAKVSQPSYCYNGPSENYLDATIVPADTVVDVLGMNSDSKDWFMIQSVIGRCWIRKDFLNSHIDTNKILVLTTAFTKENCPCRIYPREGSKSETTIPSNWRIVINAKANPNGDWLLVTPHDSTKQCWVAKKMLTTFADGLLPSVLSDVLVITPTHIPTGTRRPHSGNNNQTPIPPTFAQPTSIQPTSIIPTLIVTTPVPPTPVPPTPVPPTPVPPTPTLCWPPGHCK